jgi:hypothetical protein
MSDHVVRRKVPQRTVLAEAGDADDDEARIQLA